MTELPGKTFSGLQAPSYEIKEGNRTAQSWGLGLMCSLGYMPALLGASVSP